MTVTSKTWKEQGRFRLRRIEPCTWCLRSRSRGTSCTRCDGWGYFLCTYRVENYPIEHLSRIRQFPLILQKTEKYNIDKRRVI